MHTRRHPALAVRPHRGLRRSPRAVWRLLRLTPLGAGVAALAGLPAISAWAQATGVAANVIKPDGRTATQQQVVGTRTDITTGTIRGDNAFNSFSRFEVGQGQTVNVHVPTAAQRVINIVTDAPVKVDGVLNGLKDGSISGNLVFADPMGMVVSKSGVINVNSLQVVATTRAHADAMLDAQGRIGDAAVQQLLDGKAPRSADGKVQIDGKINALERVRIEARRIDIEGRIKAGLDAAHDAAFRAAVSSNGLSNATGMVERGGVIELVADDAIRVAGTLDASQRQAVAAPEAPQAGVGGTVRLLAADIELTATSHIDVSGLAGGGVAVIGSVSLPTVVTDDAPTPEAPVTQTLVAATGSVVQADALERGDGGRVQYLSDGSTNWGGFASSRGGALMGHGGFIEVSGRRRVQVHGLVDATAPKGNTGTLLIDPDDLTISNGADATGSESCLGTATTGACDLSTGTIARLASAANIVLQANDSISLSAGTTLDLSSILTLKTQSISFTSTDITLNANAQILTGGGNVNLIALGGQSTGDFGSGKFKYDSKIGVSVLSIGEEVKGGTIRMATGSAIITRGVAANGDATTANLVRDAGDVTLRGQTLQLDSGSSILAHKTTSFKGGDVELTGYSAQQYYLGKATATSQVTLAGTVKAESIVVNSVAKAEATPDGVTGYAIQLIAAQIGALTGMGAAYHETQADARIDVQGTARLEAATTLDIASASVNKAAGSVKVYTVKEDDTNLAALGAIYVRTGGISDVQVKSGATLKSGGKTTVAAYNDATAKGDVNILSTNSIGGAAVSYVAADVSSNAQIDAGATVNVGAIDLLSLQTGNMRNTAMAKIMRKEAVNGQTPPPDAAIGATVAISNLEVHSTATLGANVRGYDGVASTGDVTVVADSSLWQNMTSARNAIAPVGVVDKVKVGLADKLLLFGNVQSKLTTWLGDKFDALGSLKSGSPPIKASAAVTVNETNLTSLARIGNNANITATGNVAVVAQTEDRSVHNIADSKVNTKDSVNNKPAGSAAVAVGLYNHGAEATVGSNATVTGKNVGVQAQVYQPLDVTWLASFGPDGWKDPSALFLHFTPPSFGMPQFVFTSWASAVAEQEQAPGGSTDNTAAVAGAVNWTSFKNTTKSWIGTGAKVTATGADQAWAIEWSTPKTPVLDGASKFNGEAAEGVINNILVETSDALAQVQDLATNAIGEIKDLIGGKPVVLGITLNQGVKFTKALDVKALNQSAFLTFTGQPIDIGFTSVNIGTQAGTTAVGGAFNYAGSEHITVAGIDDGAVVRAESGTINVQADSQDRIIAVAPTAGKGAGAAVNLIAAYSQLDNTTVAVLSNKADAKAAALDISAVEDVSVWSAAGAAAFGASAAAVGVAVAVNELDGRTLATIADPGSLSVGAVRPTGFAGGAGTGKVDAGTVRVQADTEGTSGAISASAASVESKDSEADKNVEKDDKSAISKKWESVKSKTSAKRSEWATKLQSTDQSKWYGKYTKQLGDKIEEKQTATAPTKPPKQSSISLAGAGSSSVNLGNLDTTALLDGANLVYSGVKAANQADTSQALVRATNETHQYAISGSLALLKLNAPETKTGYGVSGAITIDLEENDTTARILNSSIKDYGTVGVQSVASGQRISVGLGIAGSSGSKPSYMLGVSYSMTDSDNSTTAAIDGGSIDGSTDHRTAVEVLAYDKTETGVGAGALTVQGNKGGAAGASIGVALVHNAVESRVAGVQTTKLSTLDVRAYDPVVLGIGAASLGISTEQNSTTIEASVTYGEVDNTTKALITDRNGTRSHIDSNAAVTVQATDAAPAATKTRINNLLAADGTPTADSTYDFGASLRSGSQEGFGGQSIGTTQPGALVIGVAGGVAIGSGNSAGAAISASRVANVHEALVEGATVTADRVNLDATDAALIVNVGVGVAGTGQKIALAGSAAITVDESRATARVGTAGKTTSVTTTGSAGLGVTSATSEKAFAVAGSVAISTQGSAGGIAGTVGVNTAVAEAQIQNATINTGTAATQVKGNTSSQHISVAAAGGYGANASINGSFVINFETARTTASISDSSVTASSLAVKAGDDASLASQVYTGAGSFGFSKDVAGGAALTSNTVALTRDATVDRSVLTLGSGTLEVQADSSVKMIGVTVAGGGGKDVAFNGAISSNEIANNTTARLAGSTVTTTGNVSVASADRSEMNYGTGAISISGQAAIGAAIGFNLVTSNITAEHQGTDSNGLKNGTGVATVGNLRVSALSDQKIVNATYGVAVGGEVGGAGSVAVNVIDTDITAHIGRGADVHADGTVAVIATAQDDIKSFGGALGLGNSAGVGLSSTVNVVRGATEASVGADDEAQVKVDAKGNGSGEMVNTGTLTQAIPGVVAPGSDPTAFDGLDAMKNYDAARAKAKMTEDTTTVKGVAVNATSLRHVLSFDTNVGGAVEGVGIGANAGAHVISSATTAEIANASVNQRDAANAVQDVAVKSSSHHVMSTFGFSLGASGGGGGAAAIGGDIFITQTTAQIRDSQVKAARDVGVKAFNESAQSGILAGIAAAGGGALAGSTGVIVFDAGVEASILGGNTRAGNDVMVNAGNTSVMNMITGAGSLSGGLALSGAITVLVADLDTFAFIGRDTDTGLQTKVSAGGDVDVKADSTSQVNTFTFAISGGGATSVAAIGAIGVATNETKASARHADLEVGVPDNWVYAANSGEPGGGTIGENNPTVTTSGAATGKLNIQATDHGLVNQLSGAAGISFGGGGGVGGTVSVMVARSNVSAELKSSEVDTKDLTISSLNSQDQLAATVGVGGSTDVGLGFAISLTMTGTGSPGSDAFGNSSSDNALGTKLMNRAAAIANTNRLGETGGMLSSNDRATLQSESKRDISGTLTQSGANSSAAFIDASTVRADQNVTVNADQETALKNIAGAAGVGLLAGAGGTVGVSYVYNASAAQVTGSNITAGGALKVEADSADKGSKHALELLTIAGGVGFAGLGASVGIGHLENQVSAQASGTLKAASVTLNATDSTSSKAENVAAAAGGGALGIAVTTIDRAGTVQAWVNKGGSNNQSVDAGSLSISASTTQDNDVISRAVAAGLGISGNGAAGTITDNVNVSAGIGDKSQIHVGGTDLADNQTVIVQATRGTSLDSGAEGVGVSGGVQIGASVAIATMGGSTEAKVGNDVVFDAGAALAVVASEAATNKINASGSASGGGALVGANATVAQSENKAQVRASIGDGTLLPDGDVVVHAEHVATQHAESFGVTVGGLLAVGANTSDAKTSASASATLGNVKTRATRLGDLDVAAQGSDTTTAKAVAGGGGLISGQAATALVNDTTSTTATISAAGTTAQGNPTDYTIRGGALTVDATHTAMVRADSDTVNASAVGASGAITETEVNNSATASVGANVRLRGLGIGISSNNIANETGSGDNASGAGGGVANGSAVVATTHVNTGSSATVGDNARLDVIGDPSSDLVGRLVLVAGTDVNTHTQGSLNTGGLIDVPYAEIESKTDAKNTVTIGTGAELRSAGDLILGTSTLNRTSASALVKTYGGIGITGGKSTAQSKQTDLIDVKANALLHAYGNISLATGRNADNAVNLMQANAVTDVYNNTAIPISYQNPANANITQSSSLNLAGGSKVQAGRSVYLRNFKGDQLVGASGEGHNPYLDLFSTSTSDSNPSQSFSGNMALNGAVTAGYYRLRDLTIAANGTLTQNVDTADTTLPVVTFTVDAAGDYRNASNQKVDASLALKPQGYIAKIEGFNPSLYYDDNAKTKLGNVPNTVLGAYVLPDLVAAGGNIEVDATAITGGGTLRAQGGPLIKVENKSNRFLIANKLVIPDIDSGGGVSFTGSGSKPGTLNVQEINKGRVPAIDLHNSYDTAFGGFASDIVLQASDDGANTVRNLRGSFKMVNDHGNVWGSAPEALTVDIQVPNGTYVIESSGYYPLGGAPQGVWAATDALFRPNDINSFVDTAAYAYYVNRWDANTRQTYEGAYAAAGAGAEAGYSRLLQGTYDNKGSGITGYLFRSNLGNKPGSYGGWGAWYDGRYGFDILPFKTLSGTWNTKPLNAGKSAGLLANRVDITAAYIDINADIRAGTARDINVTISSAANYFTNSWDKFWGSGPKLSFFDCVASVTCRSVNGLYAEANGQYKVPTSSLSYGANSPQLTVTYDPVTKRVSTAPIGTASVGSISLIGRILNSNADGSARSKIELSTGTIQLNINNQSGFAFEMPRIETGGASGDGVIRITDLNKLNGQYKPLTSWWVSKNGTDVDLYQSYTAPTYVGLTPVSSGGGATETTYDPQAGWRYQWTRTARATRSLTAPAGATMWWDYYATSWTFNYGAATPTWDITGTPGPVYNPSNTNIYSTQITQSTGFSYINVGYGYNGPADRLWAVANSVRLYQQSSVRADFGMDISFKGYSSGGVSFTSNADTYLGNTINNPTGDTSLTLTNGASLIARDGGLIRSRNLTLNAAGNILGVGQAKALELDLNGWLNTTSGGKTAITASSNLTLAGAQVGNGQQLKLKAVGDITSTGNNVTLVGYDVDLTSVGGRIGGATAGSALNVNVKSVGSGVSQRGLLTASSNGDINLNLTGGDTRVTGITAADGNVTVNTNGSLFDAREGQGGSGRSDTELQQLWEQTLKISGDKAASVQDYLKHTITPLDQQVNRDYRAYWTLRSLGSLNGAGTQITLSAQGLGTLRAQAAAALKVTNPSNDQVNQWANTLLGRYAGTFDKLLGSGWRSLGAFQAQDSGFRFSADRYNEYWTLKNATTSGGQLTAAGRDAIRQVAATVIGGSPTDTQLQAYADQRFARLGSEFSAALGSGWASQAAFTSYDASYRLAADSLLATYAFGSYWGEDRLKNEIRQSAFGQASSGGGTTIDHLNISGRKVTLTSSAASATLGRDNGFLTLNLGQPLDDIQRYALSQASAPGDVQIITNSSGQITGLKVKDTRPFFVNAKTQFDATALGQLYVLAQGSLAIGSLQSNGSLRLTAQDGITNAGTAMPIKGSSLVLDAGNGGLGTLASPLLINTPELSLARASDSIYLRQPTGNLVIDVVGAGKDVVLTLNNGALTQKQQDLLSLAGESLTLDVSGSVGSATRSLVLEARSGPLKLKSKDAWIDALGTELQLGDSNTLGFSLRALGATDVQLSGNVLSDGALQWLIGGDFVADAGKALTAKNDLTLTASSVDMALGSSLVSQTGALALNSTAGPTVLSTLTAKTGMTVDSELAAIQARNANVTLTVQDAGGSLLFNSLNAGGAGIGGVAGGDAGAPLRVAADRVALQTATGDASLKLLRPAVTVDAATVTAGALTLDAAGSLAMASDALSGQAMSLTAAHGLTLAAGKALTAGGTLALDAATLTMGAGSSASTGDRATLLARNGNAQLASVTTANGLAVDAANGSITRTAATDLLSATAPGARIALNAGNSGGTGLGTAAAPLRLSADVVSARTATGGVHLDLLKTSTLEHAVSGSGNVVLTAAADLHATGPVTAGGDIDLSVVGALTTTDKLDAGQDLRLHAASLDLGADLAALRDATLTSTSGDLLIRTHLAVGGSAVVTSAAALQAQDVQTGLDLSFDAGGPMRGDSARAGRVLTITRAPEFKMRELTSGADMSLNLGQAEIDSLTAGARLTLDALSATLGTARSGADTRLTSTGALQLTRLDSGGSTSLTADALTAGRIESAGNLDLGARTADIAALVVHADALIRVAEALRLDAATVDGQLDLASGSATLGTLASGGNARLVTTGAMALASLTSGGSASLSADALTAGRIDATGNVDVTARTATINTLVGRANALIRVAESLRLNTATVGGELDLAAGGASLGTLATGGDATLATTGAMTLASLTSGGSATLSADALAAGRVDSAGNLSLTARTAVVSAMLTRGDARVRGTDSVAINGADITGNLDLQTGIGSLGDIAVGGNAAITAGILDVDSLRTGNSLNISASNLRAQSLVSGGSVDLNTVQAEVTRIDANGVARLSSVNGMFLGSGDFGSSLSLGAGTANLGTINVASNADLGVGGPLQITRLNGGASLNLRAGSLNAEGFDISGTARLTTTGALLLDSGRFGANLTLAAANAALGTVQVAAATDLAIAGPLTFTTLGVGQTLGLTAGSVNGGSLTVGGNATLTVANDIALDNGNFGANLTLSANNADLGRLSVAGNTALGLRGALKLARMDAIGSLDLQAASLGLGTLNVGGAARLATQGSLSLANGRFDSSLDLSAGTAALGTVRVATDATLDVAGALTLDSLEVGRQLTLQAASLAAGHIGANGPARINTRGALALTTGSFSDSLTLQAGSAELGSLTVAGDALLATTGDLGLATGQFGANLGLTGAAVRIGSASITGSTRVDAARLQADLLQGRGDATLAVANDLALATGEFGAGLALSAGTATLGTVTVASDATLNVAGVLALDRLDVGGPLMLQAASLAAGRIDATGPAQLKTGGALALTTGNFGDSLTLQAGSAVLDGLTVAGKAQLTTTGDLALATGRFGADLALSAGKATLGTITVAGDTSLAAGQHLELTQLDAAKSLTLNAASLKAGAIKAAGKAALTTTGDLALASGQFGADLVLGADNATLGTVTVAGNTTLTAQRHLELTRLDAAQALTLSAASLAADTLTAGGAAALATTGSLALATGSFGNSLTLTAADANLGALTVAGPAALRTSGAMSLGQLTAAQTLTLQADSLSANAINATGAAELDVAGQLLLAQGSFGATLGLRAGHAVLDQLQVADAATLAVQGELAFDRIDAARRLSASAGSLSGRLLNVGGAAELTTGGALDLGTGQFAAGLQLKAGGSATLGRADVGGALALQAASLLATTLNVDAAASLSTTGSTRIDTGRFGATLALAAGDATLGALQLVGNGNLGASGTLAFTALDAGAALQLGAQALSGSTLKVGTQLGLVAKNATLGTADVLGDADLQVAGLALIDNRLTTGGALKVQADELRANTLQAGTALTGSGRLATVSDASAGTTLAFTTTEQLKLTQAKAGTSLALTSADTLTAASLTAGGALGVQARSAQIDTLKSGGNATLAGSTRLAVGAASVAGALSAQGGDTALAALAVAGDSTLKADRTLTLSGSNAFTGSVDASATDITIDTASFGAAARLTAGGALQATRLDATGALRLAAGSATLGRLTTASTLDLVVAQALALDQLTASGTTTVKAGDLTGRDWKTTSLTLDAASAALGSLAASADVSLATAGGLSLDQARLAANLAARSGSMQLGDIAVTGNAQLRASGLIKAQRLDVGGALDIQAGAMELGAVQPVQPLADPANPAVKVGGTLTLAADRIALVDALVTGAATLTAKDLLSLQGNSSFKAGLTASAAQLGINAASVTGDARLTSSGAMDIAQLTASGNTTVKAGTSLKLGQLDTVSADLGAGSMTLGALKLGSNLKAAATQDLAADSLFATQAIDLQAGGKVQAKLVDAPSVTINGGQQVSLDLLKAGTATLRSATQIALASGQLNSIELQAPLIQGALKVASGDTLVTRLGGVDGAAAQQITLAVDTPLRWQVPVLNAANAQFSTTGRFTQFDQARISDTMTLATPDGLIGLTSTKVQVLPGVDVQLYSPSGDFLLVRDGISAYTTALALVYKPGQQVSAPNTGLSPLAAAAAAANGSAGRTAPTARPGQLALSFEALLRGAPTAAGDKDDEDLVGELEF